ncbi:MerR family transcriptional regulator [Desulfopila sp. IMCC35006]|uniref:chaperone modulator CbpM n=1 Tax=Desulfopila sp. IMCC35006 TaxID=2569542 RepID=UPI0010AC428A|nr:chaperone modulator CbpM [Desulfopila sp. IMCC35006]TKB27041.1 MerR family transcriptional regulator [Desulfopila sp. IMCC35006]
MKEEYSCTVLDDSTTWGITEICTLCRVENELIHEMVNEGVLIPEGSSPETWRFNGLAVKRIQVTLRLQNDLRVNLPGAALVLDLLEELDELRALLRQLD